MSKILAERLTALRKSHGFSRQAMADKLQMSVNTYQKYEFDQAEPKLETLLKISKLLQVSTDYLLGVEEKDGMTPEDNHFEEELLEIYRSMPEEYRKLLYDNIRAAVLRNHGEAEELEEEIEIIIYDMLSVHKASAGCGYDLNDGDQWTTIKVLDTPELHKADFAVEVDGDSMLPEFENGDIVYVVKADEVPEGKIGLFQQNGKGYIKKAGKNRLISINPDFDDIFPEDGEIEICGIVIGKAELP